jgi:hypothetical protein
MRIEDLGPIEPLERGERFDFPLIRMLDPIGGDIVDSGTFLSGGGVEGCSITIDIPNEAVIKDVLEILKNGRIPIGATVSRLTETDDWEVVHQF